MRDRSIKSRVGRHLGHKRRPYLYAPPFAVSTPGSRALRPPQCGCRPRFSRPCRVARSLSIEECAPPDGLLALTMAYRPVLPRIMPRTPSTAGHTPPRRPPTSLTENTRSSRRSPCALKVPMAPHSASRAHQTLGKAGMVAITRRLRPKLRPRGGCPRSALRCRLDHDAQARRTRQERALLLGSFALAQPVRSAKAPGAGNTPEEVARAPNALGAFTAADSRLSHHLPRGIGHCVSVTGPNA